MAERQKGNAPCPLETASLPAVDRKMLDRVREDYSVQLYPRVKELSIEGLCDHPLVPPEFKENRPASFRSPQTIQFCKEEHFASADDEVDSLDLDLSNDTALHDKFGNAYFRHYNAGVLGDRKGYHYITYLPQPYLTTNEQDESRTVPLDLTPLGKQFKGRTLAATFLQKPEFPIAQIGEYRFFTDLSPSQFRNHTKHFAPFVSGIEQAERAFGLSPGSQIKQVYVQNEATPNAFAILDQPETVAITTGQLQRMTDPMLCARHESFHAFDIRHGQHLSGGEFENAFQKAVQTASEDRFIGIAQLSECNFFENEAAGGHAYTSASEAFASLMNSLLHPQWETRIREVSPQFRKAYYQLCLGARSTFDAVVGDATGPAIPIRERLRSAIIHLERVYKVKLER